MAYTRITAIWTGATGLPGYSRFHYNGDLTAAEAAVIAESVRAFFDAIKAYLPASVDITVQSACEIFNIAGDLIGIVDAGPVAPVGGSSVMSFSAASGGCVTWLTDAFLNGRSVRGRTFLVPLTAYAFADDGTLDNPFVVTASSAAVILGLNAVPMVIVSRGSTGAVTALSEVIGARVADKAAVLRSRRD